jgi:hypothetical protein
MLHCEVHALLLSVNPGAHVVHVLFDEQVWQLGTRAAQDGKQEVLSTERM